MGVFNFDSAGEVKKIKDPVALKADRTAGSAWLVEEGLNEGDRLITEGLQFVQPGAEVKAVPAGNVETEQPAQDAEQASGQD